MSFRRRAYLFSAVAGAAFLQAGIGAAQRLPSVPSPPTVPGPPRAGPSGGLQSGISGFRQNPQVAPAQARRFDTGGVGTVPGADNATQSTNATNATNATSGRGYSNGKR